MAQNQAQCDAGLMAPHIASYTGSLVYFIGHDDGPVKIGVTTRLRQRLTALRISSPYDLRVLAARPGDRWFENKYHQQFSAFAMRGEHRAVAPLSGFDEPDEGED